jgi:enterobacterial common antigen flippase
LVFLSLITVVFCGFYALPFLWASFLGAVATLLSGAYSLRVFSTFMSWDQVPLPVRRLLDPFRLVLSKIA